MVSRVGDNNQFMDLELKHLHIDDQQSTPAMNNLFRICTILNKSKSENLRRVKLEE